MTAVHVERPRPLCGRGRQFVEYDLVAGGLHCLADRIKLKVAAVAMVDKGRNDIFQGQRAPAQREPLMVGRRWPEAIGHLHDRRAVDQERQQAAKIGVVSKVPEVDCQANAGIRPPPFNKIVDQFQGVDKPRQEATPYGGSTVEGLDGQPHAGPHGLRGQLLDCLHQEPTRVGPGVAAPASTVEHDHLAAERSRPIDRLSCIGHALIEGAAVTASKAPGPLHARHANPKSSEEPP